MTQKEAIFQIIKTVLGEKYSPQEDMRPYFGSKDSRTTQRYQDNSLSYQLMNTATALLITKVKAGEISHPLSRRSGKKLDDRELCIYGRKIIFNWLNKDKRLNGGEEYVSLKSEENIFRGDLIIKILLKEKASLIKLPPKRKSKFENFHGTRNPTYTSEELETLSLINDLIEKRKDELRKCNQDLSFVSQCMQNETILKNFGNISGNPLLSVEDRISYLKEVEKIILLIMEQMRSEMQKEQGHIKKAS